jgi:hypothetical protein
MMQMARFLVFAGVLLIVAGGLVYLFGRAGITFGRLPGDIRIQGNNMTCVLALGTSILLSIILTILVNVVARILK